MLYKPSKKLKTLCEKGCELIVRGQLRLYQLAGMDPEEIIVVFYNDEINRLQENRESKQRPFTIFWEEIHNN